MQQWVSLAVVATLNLKRRMFGAKHNKVPVAYLLSWLSLMLTMSAMQPIYSYVPII